MCVYPQPTDRRTSLDALNPRSRGDPALHHKINTIGVGGGSKTLDRLRAPDLPQRRASVDVCQPRRMPSPTPTLSRHMQPMPLPLPPQSGLKTNNRRPGLGLGTGGHMPSNLMNELNAVLSKSGRIAKSDDG